MKAIFLTFKNHASYI